MLVNLDCRFKCNQENIERIVEHFGLRKIQNTLYVGELDNNECKVLMKEINEIIKENDSFLMIPVCKNCFSKKEYCGRELKFKNDLYRVY